MFFHQLGRQRVGVCLCARSIMKPLNQAPLRLTEMTIAGRQAAHQQESMLLCNAKDPLGRKGKCHGDVFLILYSVLKIMQRRWKLIYFAFA